MDETPLCADCGSEMVLLQSKNGPTAGRYYFSCTRYPACYNTLSATAEGVPLAAPTTAHTRRMRIKAHDHFDRLWQSGGMTREAAYAWLADAMEMTRAECHIRFMLASECERVIALSDERYARVLRKQSRR